LPDGTVLAYDLVRSQDTGVLAADRYYPNGHALPGGGISPGQWIDASATNGTVPNIGLFGTNIHENGAPLLLPNGSVLWLGGNGQYNFFNLTSSSWSYGGVIGGTTGHLTADAPAALLPNGHVLLVAYSSFSWAPNVPSVLFDYNPDNGSYTRVDGASNPSPNLTNVSAIATSMLVLPNGHLLFSAGPQLWDYTPDSGTPAQTPVVAGIGNLNNGVYDGQPNADGSYNLSGTYLTGFSEGAAQGDQFNGCATNYPIVKLTLGSRVWYLKTTGWTPGVGDSTLRTVKVEVPGTVPAGTLSLQVVASGVASPAVNFIHGSGPVYADSGWADIADGTSIANPDPLAPGAAAGIMGVNCFGSVSAAIAAAAPAGRTVIVSGGIESGVFHEQVAVDSRAPLYLQGGAITFDSLVSSAADTTTTAQAAEKVLLDGATLTIDGDNGSSVYHGSLAGNGSLVKTSAGTFAFDGPIDFRGSPSGLGSLTVNGSGTVLAAGTVLAPGGVYVNDLGSKVIIGMANVLEADTVTVNANLGLAFSTLAASVGALQGSGNIALGNNSLTVGGNNASTPFSGAFVNSVGTVTKIGTGTWSLAGDNSNFFGTVAVNAGALRILSENALAGCTVVVNDAGGLDLSAVSTAFLGGLGGNSVGSVDLRGATLTVGQNNTPTTYSGTLQDSGQNSSFGSIIKVGAGALTLAGTSGNHPLVVTVSGGFLKAGSAAALQNAFVTVNPSGVLDGTGVTSFTLAGLAGTGSVRLGTAVLTVSNDGPAGVYSGSLSGSGGLAKFGHGAFQLGGDNSSFSGFVDIFAGTVVVASANALAGCTVNVVSGPGLAFSGVLAANFGALSGPRDIDNSGVNLVVGGNGADGTYSGILSGSGSFTKVGAGRQILTGPNTYSGMTTVTNGKLEIDGSVTSAVTVASGATLRGIGTINGSVTVNGTLEAGIGTTVGTLTIGGSLTVNGTFVARITSFGFDKVNVGGDLSLGSGGLWPQLSIILDTTPTNGNTFDIIDLATGSQTQGHFGAVMIDFTYNYHGGDTSNDVVLTYYGIYEGGD
jgi:autotransporter-associated beta strand protein